MFHKYDYGTASQITSRKWASEPIEMEKPSGMPFAGILFIEVCAIAALLLIPHNLKNSALANANHKNTAHAHHLAKHIG